MVQSVVPLAVSIHTHRLFSELVRIVCESRLELRWGGSVRTLAEGRRLCVERRPHLIILDTDFSDGEGWDLWGDVLQKLAAPKVVVVTDRADEYTAMKASRSGAAGIVHAAEASVEDITSAFELVLQGGCYRSPSLRDVMARTQSSTSWTKILSARETELIRYFALGTPEEEIAARLEVLPRTVRNLRDRLREKLGLASATELVRWADDCGIVRRNRLASQPAFSQ